MRRFFIVFAIVIIAFSIGCKKDSKATDTPLTGTWVKGNNAGDTLYFTKDQDKNMLVYNISFNAALPAVAQTEYSFANGKLFLKNFMSAQNDFHVIQSFTWVQVGSEFEVLGYEIFPFMSSTLTRFRYRKIN